MEYGAKRHSSIRWYLFGILVALELLMSFSFLGYFHAEPISITIAYIPVLLAGALLGPLESMAVGTVFGLASMWKASASYVMPFDRLFSPIMSGYPVESFLLSVGSRALFGLLIGVLYMAAKKGRPSGVWMGVVSFFGQTIHSTLVYGTMWIFFPEAGLTLLNTVESFFTLNNIVANLLSAGLVVLFWHIMRSPTWNQFVQRLEAAKTVQASDRLNILPLVGIILLAIISSVAVALYFVQRMVSVLQQKGVTLPDDGYDDMVHLQIQFLFGILAMMVLVTIFLVLNRRYNTYMRREARTDILTGAMNRRAFFQSSKRVLSHFNFQGDATGYFVMVDMDRFKEINDLYGHPEGDRVLKEAVLAMNAIFGGDGLIGRVGGDEFAILIYIPTTRPLLEGQLQRLMESIQRIRMDNRAISCSIGAQPITPDRTAEDLYRDADNLLYTAKNRGRNQYMIGPVESMVQANTVAARDIEVSTETAEEADQSGDGARGT